MAFASRLCAPLLSGVLPAAGLLLAGQLIGSTGAAAQDYMAIFNMNSQAAIGIAGTAAVNSAIARQTGTAGRGAGTSRQPTAAPSGPPADPSILRYGVDPAVAQEDSAAFPGAAQAGDVKALFAQQIRAYGARPDDLADVTAAYWAQMWVIANQAGDFTPEQFHGLREQLRAMMLTNPAVGRLTPAEKQRVGETLVYQTMLAGNAYLTARHYGDQANVQKFSDAAQERNLRRGLDLRDLELTEAGFRPR